MSNSTNPNQTDLIWMESVLFTYLVWLRTTITKHFPNCLLMNQKDCLYSWKNYCYTFFFPLSFFLTTIALGCLPFNSVLYFLMWWRVNMQLQEKGFLFISSLFPYTQFISLLVFINAPLLSLFLVPSHYSSNRIMSFHCPFFLICLLSLP